MQVCRSQHASNMVLLGSTATASSGPPANYANYRKNHDKLISTSTCLVLHNTEPVLADEDSCIPWALVRLASMSCLTVQLGQT